MKAKGHIVCFFFDKKGLLECKPEWNREAITVFSRLPSLRRLQATPPLQTSLIPFRSATICTYGKAKLGLAAITVFSILYNIPRFFEVSWETSEEGKLEVKEV